MPLKPLQVVVQLLLDSLAPSRELAAVESQPENFVAAEASWLPDIQRLLPHSWATTLAITATSAKSDNTRTITDIWDKRVSLVLPWDHTNMAGLRSLALGRWQRHLRWDFQAFMCRKYGEGWLDQLSKGRRHRLMQQSTVHPSPSALSGGGVEQRKG
jgi:hypothetical protein